MTETRWARVESLFHEALAKSGEYRERFLAEACQGDDALLHEVRSLLAHYQAKDELLDNVKLADLVTDRGPLPVFESGEQVGNYEIIHLLGKGGMGEVYLARDSRLSRKVALKILPRELAGDPVLVERLWREAQTASALNHPNILTIYEFGRQGETHYMASEFIEGRQLREYVGRLSTPEALQYARQIGQALDAAHAVGVVHRDIKPENIMVRADGYLKVLDFGLAKLVSLQLGNGKSLYERLSAGGLNSVPGLLIGTVNYMSPEQVRGQAVDLRTDVWSWGVVLYEMLTGRRPFEGETPGDSLAAILHTEPAAPSDNKELNSLIAKSLAKDAAQRYPNMQEALQDLSHVSIATGQISQGYFVRPWRTRILGRQVRSANLLRRRVVVALLLAVILLAVLAGYQFFYQRTARQTFHIASMKRLTTSGNVIQIAISPDHNYMAYAVQTRAGQALRIRQIETNADAERLPAAPREYTGITFSRNGQLIYYVLGRKLYRVPLLAGDPKVVTETVDSPISFSPDGDRFTFLRLESTVQASLILKTVEASTETTLLTLKAPEYLETGPVWSPDGTSVICGTFNKSNPGIRIISVGVRDGQVKKVVGPYAWFWMGKPVWLDNGHSLLLPASSIGSYRSQLLQISWPGGDVFSVYPNTASHPYLDVSADLKNILAVQLDRVSGLWIASLAGGAPQSIPEMGERLYGIAWAKSGKLISESDIGGHPDLWSIELQSRKLQPLTDDMYVKQYPTASADGQYLVYASNQNGTSHIWRSNQDGSNPIRLTSGASAEEAVITPDGKWVVYTSIESGSYGLWKVSVNGGLSVQITKEKELARHPAISPDGRFIACRYSSQGKAFSTVILRREDGEVVRSFPGIPAAEPPPPLRWSADGKSLLYVSTDTNGVSNIWAQPVDGGVSWQLTHFSEGLIFAFAPSLDGKYLACIRGRISSDAVLLEAAK